MFQLTPAMTPAPGRAVIAGAAVGGGVTLGAKTTIDLPDFMTFASIGAAIVAPGKVRQDPAGGGETVPGGTVFVPPAGHPEPIEGTPAVLPDLSAIAGKAISSDAHSTTTDPVDRPATLPGKLATETIAPVVPKNRATDMEKPESPPHARLGKGPKLSKEAPHTADGPPPPAAAIDPVAVPPMAIIPVAVPPIAPVDSRVEPLIAVIHPLAEPSVAVTRPLAGPPAAVIASPTLLTPASVVTQDVTAATATAITPAWSFPVGIPATLKETNTQVPAGEPTPKPTIAVSLAPIGRMLGAAAPASEMLAGTIAVRQAAPVSADPVAPGLPAMPPSVASFLTSLGSRTLTTPSAISDTKMPARTVEPTAFSPVISSMRIAPMPVSTGPAGQLFADAIHAASGPGHRAPADTAPDVTILTFAAGAPTAMTAASAPNRAPIDLTHPHWPAKMIERIEYLRDAADAQDTRIKLIPDALGAIDVSMKREGDTVRVHLAAERPETRAMIADAQPRLAELGEQRGLKIAASSGQGFSQPGAQDFHQPRGNPAPHQHARPASARAGDKNTQDDDGDQRLA